MAVTEKGETDFVDEAPDTGELRVTLPLAPVSLQASRKQKTVLGDAVRGAFRRYKFILTGEVKMDIEWMIHERERYETSASPDVDNVLKPVVDATVGSQGILVDDCHQHRLS
jgi:Holliday junction resolvase RusA-like endonuclease